MMSRNDEDFYFECEFTNSQRNMLIAIISGKKKVAQISKQYRKELLEALMLARKTETSLMRELLDWDEVRETAKEQGISEADAMWDLMNRRQISEN
jgi:hypothetical protein